ncbi:mucin-associated surface protein (MASP), putative [Trypanosoma cruzi marinkellei]|uniref:Mucin-associated surface protein (MASP), putative n=1 Tax=Trypanosoma cruzi marinkellei TaxID=85056 RepID=K2MUZ4_TRYCR|nr:mucin-associated surface protein (MASP), putative [Trypanosoma cruzi marinkellei]
MAMTMTGRVLLVCALCVLWCGAGGAFANNAAEVTANGAANNRTAADEMILNWYDTMQHECENDTARGGKFNASVDWTCMSTVMKGVCDAFYNKNSSETHDPDVVFICTYYATKPVELVESSTPQGPTSDSAASNTTSSEGTPKNAPESDASERGEGKEGEKEHGNTKEKALEAADVKSITSGDSSTAVSHTTSPLLLSLLVVACAAAMVVA